MVATKKHNEADIDLPFIENRCYIQAQICFEEDSALSFMNTNFCSPFNLFVWFFLSFCVHPENLNDCIVS